MAVPLPVWRLLLVFAVAAVGLAIGLSNEDWIDLWDVDPDRAVDSEVLLARGFPHAWLVVDSPNSLPSPIPRRIARYNLLQSTFFCLACSAVAVCAGLAVVRRLRRSRGRLSHATTGLRTLAALATGACAASYAYLFVGVVDYWLLTAATCGALLSCLLLIRSRADVRRHWLLVGLVLLTTLLVVAFVFDPEIAVLLSAVGILLAISLTVALALLYSLASTSASCPRRPSRGWRGGHPTVGGGVHLRD